MASAKLEEFRPAVVAAVSEMLLLLQRLEFKIFEVRDMNTATQRHAEHYNALGQVRALFVKHPIDSSLPVIARRPPPTLTNGEVIAWLTDVGVIFSELKARLVTMQRVAEATKDAPTIVQITRDIKEARAIFAATDAALTKAASASTTLSMMPARQAPLAPVAKQQHELPANVSAGSYKGQHSHVELTHEGPLPTWGHKIHEHHPQDAAGRAYYGAEDAGGRSGPQVASLTAFKGHLFDGAAAYKPSSLAARDEPIVMAPIVAPCSKKVPNPSLAKTGFKCMWRECRAERLFKDKNALLVHINDEHRGLYCKWAGCMKDTTFAHRAQLYKHVDNDHIATLAPMTAGGAGGGGGGGGASSSSSAAAAAAPAPAPGGVFPTYTQAPGGGMVAQGRTLQPI